MPEMPVRRVLMTTDTVGGVWTFALDLAEALITNYDVEVLLATLGGQPSAGQRTEAEALPRLSLTGSDYKLEWMDDPWRDVEESRRWLLRLERDYNADVIHLNSYGHGACAFQTPAVMTVHSCVLSWWKAVKGESAPPRWNRYREEVKAALHAVDALTVPSRAMASSLSDYGILPSRCEVIPNGRPAKKFRRGLKEPLVFTAGRLWDEAKNTALVARVAASLAWPVYAAGDVNHPDGSVVGFRDCRLTGWLSGDAMVDWYARAAIYVLPARYEPFGLSALEAALSGCALVLGDIPSLREIWADTAMFVDPEQPEALQKALETLISKPALREDLARRSYARALTYDSERTAGSYMSLYKTAVAGKHQCVS
jgi:glycosyltransferase involved in cell wall biosynthesis